MASLNKYTVKANYTVGPLISVATANINATAGTLSIPNHGLSNGDVCGQILANSLAITGVTTKVTPVYVIVVDGSTISLATTRANAFAGTAAAITHGGSISLYKNGLSSATNGNVLSGIIIPKGNIIVNAAYVVNTTGADRKSVV